MEGDDEDGVPDSNFNSVNTLNFEKDLFALDRKIRMTQPPQTSPYQKSTLN